MEETMDNEPTPQPSAVDVAEESHPNQATSQQTTNQWMTSFLSQSWWLFLVALIFGALYLIFVVFKVGS